MTTIAATEAKNRFGELLDLVNREPVEIAKKGRAVAVVLSAESYRDIERRLGELGGSACFEGMAEWRKKSKRRKSAKALDEADYQEHLEDKYGQ